MKNSIDSPIFSVFELKPKQKVELFIDGFSKGVFFPENEGTFSCDFYVPEDEGIFTCDFYVPEDDDFPS